MRSKNRILVFRSNANQRHATALILRRAGYAVISAPSIHEIHQSMHDHDFDSFICDLEGLNRESLQLVHESLHMKPDMPVIILTSDPALRAEFAAMDWKRVIYQPQPVDPECLISLLIKILPAK